MFRFHCFRLHPLLHIIYLFLEPKLSTTIKVIEPKYFLFFLKIIQQILFQPLVIFIFECGWNYGTHRVVKKEIMLNLNIKTKIDLQWFLDAYFPNVHQGWNYKAGSINYKFNFKKKITYRCNNLKKKKIFKNLPTVKSCWNQ